MASILDRVLRKPMPDLAVPICPDHKVEMQMRGKIGRPARFSDTTEEQYAVIYYCPVPGCDHSKEITKRRAQVAVPGEAPARPTYSRSSDQ